MNQQAFFETLDYPLADAFEAADNRSIFDPQPLPLPPLQISEKPAMAGHCLKCGKPSPSMFCNQKCRQSWIGGMNAWHAKLPKANPSDTQELFGNP